ncbi:MAG: monomethylamine:corrinoid methyltransferase, partial [Candidatus Aerophobus sp.]
MAVSILEVLERIGAGDYMKEDDFDLSIFKETEKLKKESGIRYDPENPVPNDDGLADALFELGLKFFVDIGVYCTSTGRVIKFTEPEVREALRRAPSEMTLGEEEDQVVVSHQGIEPDKEPIVGAGIQTIPYSDEEAMFKLCKLCAQDRCVDGIWGGVLDEVDGHKIVTGTPIEIYSYRKLAKTLRAAVTAAGRPGMFILQNAPTSVATIGMCDSETGLRPTDPFFTSGISEMKVSYDDLDRVVYGKARGLPLHASQVCIIGGFSGSIEGAAMVCVASALQGLLVHRGDLINPAVVHSRMKSVATRDQLWVRSLAFQALNRNTSLVLIDSGGDHPAAGPGTRQYLYEAAAGFIASTACGGHCLEGTRKFAVGEKKNFGSPLESRWMGELCKGSAGLSREKANEIVKYLLGKYEANLENAPEGFVFEELYDPKKMKPRTAYLNLY